MSSSINPIPIQHNELNAAVNKSSSANPTLPEQLSPLADEVSPLADPSKIMDGIKIAKKSDWKTIALRALSLMASIALGALTGLAVAGVMVTPVGWALAGGALLIGLVGAAAYGGPKEFVEALKYSLLGFGMGSGIGSLAGLAVVSAAGATVSGADLISVAFITAVPGTALIGKLLHDIVQEEDEKFL